MKKVAILGHFGFGMDKANGQTIKTKIIGAELRRQYGDSEVDFYDTMGGVKFLMRLPFVLFTILKNHRNVIILPAYKAVCIIVPLLTLMNLFFYRSLHYVVIGGRLPLLIQRFPLLKPALRRLDCIYPETQLMVEQLKKSNICNTTVMPNCKSINILKSENLPQFKSPPYKLCTFSRVEKTKGIEDAVLAVNECNRRLGSTVFRLDIYGLVQEQEWFDQLMNSQSKDEIAYRGVIPFDKSTEVLCQYYALLFPTYYAGEGFAGTLIDALAAGLPTIASDWKSNGEIVETGITGILFPTHSVSDLTNILIDISSQTELLNSMRGHCLKKAEDYSPEKVVKTLTNRFK